jgi:serine/threonine protein kinase
LKPENLLLDKDYNLKLADFGFATMLGGKAYCGWLKTYLGTQGYMAPEILSKSSQYYGISTDIFAAGVILFILVTGKPPWSKASPQNMNYHKFCTNRHTEFWKEQRNQIRQKDTAFDFSKDFMSLINSMLAFDPTHRPTVGEILTSEWMRSADVPTHPEVLEEFNRRTMIIAPERMLQDLTTDQMNADNLETVMAQQGDTEDARSRGPNPLSTQSLEVVKFPVGDFGGRKSAIVSNLDCKTFFKTIAYIASRLGANEVKTNVNKAKITLTKFVEEESLILKVNFYESDAGLKIADFIKKTGPLMEFHKLVAEIKRLYQN